MSTQSISSYQQYLAGGGEMGELTRGFDWSKTSIGTPDTWPQSLLTTVNIILNSRFPMFLYWGPDLIQFYNDAYRPSLGTSGKHPTALGQRGVECWPEIWPVIKPLIDQVMTTGESTWSENQLIPIYRNNKLEDVYWTFSYSRVIDETGQAAGVLVICSETTKQVESFNALKSAKDDLEFAIEAADLGTWDLNPVTNHFIGNERLKSWFGIEGGGNDIELQLATDVIIEEDRKKVTEAIQKALKKGTDGNYSVVYTIQNPKDNIRRIVQAKGKAIFNADGEAIRFSGILEDVTEDYQLQQRKDEFISVASHELKTPITSISASMQILQKLTKTEPLPEKVTLFINKANNNLGKLVHLLDDLLNVTKIQQGQLGLNKTRFNLTELIRDCCEHINVDNQEFIINTTDAIMVDADYRRIDQVMVNLLNNAVKYSPQSKRVEINIMHDDEQATVAVRDFGIGINPEKLPHLFDRYYRVDALGHQFSGLGLGLYISSEIIHRHGGQIGADSTLGNGSNFWFSIPLEEDL